MPVIVSRHFFIGIWRCFNYWLFIARLMQIAAPPQVMPKPRTIMMIALIVILLSPCDLLR